MVGPGHPETGARFLLIRQRAEASEAEYLATVLLPNSQRAEYGVVIADGTSALDHRDGVDRDELRNKLMAIVRSMAKSGAWPRRVTRWKGLDTER